MTAHNGKTVSHWDVRHGRATPLHAATDPYWLASVQLGKQTTYYVFLSGNLTRVSGIVGEYDHVLFLVPELGWKPSMICHVHYVLTSLTDQETLHVVRVINAATQLSLLTGIIDSNLNLRVVFKMDEQPSPCTQHTHKAFLLPLH